MRPLKIVLYILLVLVVGYFIGFYVRAGFPWTNNTSFLVIIITAGAFGGLLYTVRDSGLKCPYWDEEKKRVLNIGWIADCAYGIGGAFAVFLILPIESMIVNGETITSLAALKIWSLIKLIALALVGGYGGRSLVDRALANIAKDAKEAKADAQEARKDVEKAKKNMEQAQITDTEALEMVHRHLDEGEEEQNVDKLKEAIKKATWVARFQIFKDAREVREKNWKKNAAFMKRTIPVFEGLIENESGEKYHRNHGQLAYALKDQGGDDESKNDYKRALEELNKAILIRDELKTEGFLMYEFNRIICQIKLGGKNDNIIKDIKAVAQKPELLKDLKEADIIKKWAEKNKIKLSEIK